MIARDDGWKCSYETERYARHQRRRPVGAGKMDPGRYADPRWGRDMTTVRRWCRGTEWIEHWEGYESGLEWGRRGGWVGRPLPRAGGLGGGNGTTQQG